LVREFIENFLRVSPSIDVTRELEWLLINAAREWQLRCDLAAVTPSPGEMNVIVGNGATRARKLRDWSRALPAALFLKTTVLIPGDPPLRAVIEHLAHTFDLLSDMYPRTRGRPPGRRGVAQSVAAPLLRFAYRHAPDSTEKDRWVFVRECLELLKIGFKIGCPDPADHPAEFTAWFRAVERRAQPGRERVLAVKSERARRSSALDRAVAHAQQELSQ
jgi:hypothetical protein